MSYNNGINSNIAMSIVTQALRTDNVRTTAQHILGIISF